MKLESLNNLQRAEVLYNWFSGDEIQGLCIHLLSVAELNLKNEQESKANWKANWIEAQEYFYIVKEVKDQAEKALGNLKKAPTKADFVELYNRFNIIFSCPHTVAYVKLESCPTKLGQAITLLFDR